VLLFAFQSGIRQELSFTYKNYRDKVVAITGEFEISYLGENTDFTLNSRRKEACPNNLAQHLVQLHN
jgi:D-arabinose 5-phosphate isomerase GutQ